MIRKASLSDIPRLVGMGKRFIAETEYHGKISENETALTETMTGLVSSEHSRVLVADDGQPFGMIGVFVFSHPFSAQRIGCESFWWIEPEHRGTHSGVRLLKEAERWAKQRGAERMIMVHPAGASRVGRIYELLGYDKLEEQYQKDL